MKNRTSYIIAAAIIAGLIGYGAGCYFWSDEPSEVIIIEENNQGTNVTTTPNVTTTTTTSTAVTSTTAIKITKATTTPKTTPQPLKPVNVIFSGIFLAGNETVLLEYNEADYAKALAHKKVVILYFDTAWCASCQQEFNSAMLAYNLLTVKDIVGFRVNFNDDATDVAEQKIAQQFNVTEYQTKVVLKNGKHLLTATDIWNTDRYLRAMSSALY